MRRYCARPRENGQAVIHIIQRIRTVLDRSTVFFYMTFSSAGVGMWMIRKGRLHIYPASLIHNGGATNEY